MIIENFKSFKGQHCETTATGSLLNHLGIELSEPMLFGIGEGLGFILWNMKTMDFPFIGGRVKTDKLTENICRNLNLELRVTETSSIKKAWQHVKTNLSKGIPVGLKLDCYHLDYFSSKIHFAGHYAAMYGHDEKDAFLIDTDQQGHRVKTSLENLALARNEKGPMSSRNRSFTIHKTGKKYDLKEQVKIAIRNNAENYLNPPIKNLTYKGIIKTASEIKAWFKRSENIKVEFQTSAMLMERAGTGGSLFRNFYRDFLLEASDILESDKIKAVHKDFVKIADHWAEIARLFTAIGETEDYKYVEEASELLLHISDYEKASMNKLLACTS